MTNIDPFRVELADGVAEVLIDHPPSNLVDGAFIAGLSTLIDALEAEDDARAVVFSSADPDFFLMHGDVHGILAMPVGAHRATDAPNAAAAIFERMHRSPLFTIALVDGAARGGGAEFLAALDFRIGSDRAQLGQPEASMGILPGAGGTARLPHLLGRSRALDVILTGRDVSAAEAREIGWLDRVVAPAELADEGRRLARRIAAMPAASVAAVKRVVDASLESFSTALVQETNEFGSLIASGAHTDRMERFLAAGGQTREGETARWHELDRAMSAGN